MQSEGIVTVAVSFTVVDLPSEPGAEWLGIEHEPTSARYLASTCSFFHSLPPRPYRVRYRLAENGTYKVYLGGLRDDTTEYIIICPLPDSWNGHRVDREIVSYTEEEEKQMELGNA